jgi:glycosyltransferase involved in cell wall biosynthesis
MASRLLSDKGVNEFVDAARILRSRSVNARFMLIGTPDPGNPESVTESLVNEWQAEGVIEYLGFQSDIANIFSKSHIITLPSYREGLPKVLIEAAACGRAVVTTDTPGCRDAIEPNVTGLLVPPRDAKALAEAINCLINDTRLRERMGKAGRSLAEREFGINKVVTAHLDIYNELAMKKNI